MAIQEELRKLAEQAKNALEKAIKEEARWAKIKEDNRRKLEAIKFLLKAEYGEKSNLTKEAPIPQLETRFANKTIKEAAIEILKEASRPLRMREILESLNKGGKTVDINVLYAVLAREIRTGVIKKVDRGVLALTNSEHNTEEKE